MPPAKPLPVVDLAIYLDGCFVRQIILDSETLADALAGRVDVPPHEAEVRRNRSLAFLLPHTARTSVALEFHTHKPYVDWASLRTTHYFFDGTSLTVPMEDGQVPATANSQAATPDQPIVTG